MLVRHDFKCNECNFIFEELIDIGKEHYLECPNCHKHNATMVFTKYPQTMIQHADIVDKITQRNTEIMEKVYNEDSVPDSEYQKEWVK
jgi:putative FmdB family regulatory protein